ncbi:MAG: YchJ family protein [Leptolyngbya sp. SIO1E4]|nr:YchJ family protein [Leptolyngbya sp. SIO1E4]
MKNLSVCPCGSQRAFSACCEPYLLGQAIAPTAEALMRSRYTAYCQGNVDYLVATHHPSKRTFSDRITLSKSVKNTTWLGLTIVSTARGQPQDETGMVEFVAIYRTGNVGQLHERSRFQKQKGRWFYLEGEHLPPVAPKRNEPCWCGSGKKFKQCHGQASR